MTITAVKDILSALVAFDTTSRNSNLALVEWVENYLAQFGVASERIYDASGKKANLWATIGPVDVPGYVLSGHTDVVPVDGQAWSSDPFTLVERDGKLFGRGACDMKGFLAVCLAIVPTMVQAKLAHPIHLAFSYDEEVGCIGVRGILAKLATQPVKPLGAFIGEPTSMQVVVGHKGKRSVRAIVRGKGCHSSLAPEGINAAEWGARLVSEIRNIAEEFATKGARDELYDVPFTTVHVGVLRGGTALNIVPDECEILFEVRSIGADDPDAVVERIVAYARDTLEPAMRAGDPSAGFDFDVYAGFPGLNTSPGADIATLARALVVRNDHAKVAYGTEAGLFDAMANIPSVIIGPGSISQAHKPDEFIEVAQLARCAEFVERLIERCSTRWMNDKRTKSALVP